MEMGSANEQGVLSLRFVQRRTRNSLKGITNKEREGKSRRAMKQRVVARGHKHQASAWLALAVRIGSKARIPSRVRTKIVQFRVIIFRSEILARRNRSFSSIWGFGDA